MLRGALARFNLTEESYAPQLNRLNRFGQPPEVAEASSGSLRPVSYVTGTVIHVDAHTSAVDDLGSARTEQSRRRSAIIEQLFGVGRGDTAADYTRGQS
jgi:hypothetical protein